jgi:hypothetical protein
MTCQRIGRAGGALLPSLRTMLACGRSSDQRRSCYEADFSVEPVRR